MLRASAGFAIGAALCHELPELPDTALTGLAPLLLLLARLPGAAGVLIWVLLGLAWTDHVARDALAQRLPAAQAGADLPVRFQVVGIPSLHGGAQIFEARVLSAPGGQPRPGCRLRLRSFKASPVYAAGERWDATVRLRPPRGLRNVESFHREHRALREGRCASGYVRAHPAPRRIAAVPPGAPSRIRADIAQRVRTALGEHPAAGVILALILGERGGITEHQGALLRETGTAHLVAISGLHVGLAAGLGLMLGSRLARSSTWLCRRVPAHHLGVALALCLALGYAALAGFSLSTRRAVIMLSVLVLVTLRRRRVAPSAALGAALLLVLVLDPLAVRGADLWLSFIATAALLFCLRAADRGSGAAPQRWLGGLVRAQWVAGVAMLPVTAWLFGPRVWFGPVFNAFAVPLAGTVVVPLALLGGALAAFAPALAGPPLRLAAGVMQWLLQGLAWALELLPAAPAAPVLASQALAPVILGAMLLLFARPRWQWPLALVLLLPLVLPQRPRPASGELWLHLLDVGQGLAAVVRTRDRVLVYDTGPPWSGGRVLLEYLRRAGIDRVDALVVSHGDSDHAGGAPALIEGVRVIRVISDAAIAGVEAEPCADAPAWSWDGVHFEPLHPLRARRGNDGSCVLRIAGAGGAVLLPGDIEVRAEAELHRRHPGRLAAEVLVSPHHGSSTSSSPALLDAVRPVVTLIPSGHRNRYGFPHPKVLARLRDRGVFVADTGCSGLLALVLAADGQVAIDAPASRRVRFWTAADDPGRCPAPRPSLPWRWPG